MPIRMTRGPERRALPLIAAGLLLAGCTSPLQPAESSPTPNTLSRPVNAAPDYTSVVEEVSPSIVLVETPTGLGSGVVFDSRGDIVTNAHVTSGATQFFVATADGKQFAAKLVGTYASSDLAVLRASTNDLKPARWGDSDMVEVGQVVLALGNPLGFQSSVTEGIVSGLGRTVSEPNGVVLTGVIQTSAAINPGNSGGALVNTDGEVVGMPTLAAVDPALGGQAPGIGFALPSNLVVYYANQIIDHGGVPNASRADLGVRVGDATGSGVVVVGLVEGGAAWDAGVHMGDVIYSMDSRPIPSATALADEVAHHAAGEEVTLGVRRGNATIEIKVKLGLLAAQ